MTNVAKVAAIVAYLASLAITMSALADLLVTVHRR
jgi:hypothetical protein